MTFFCGPAERRCSETGYVREFKIGHEILTIQLDHMTLVSLCLGIIGKEHLQAEQSTEGVLVLKGSSDCHSNVIEPRVVGGTLWSHQSCCRPVSSVTWTCHSRWRLNHHDKHVTCTIKLAERLWTASSVLLISFPFSSSRS